MKHAEDNLVGTKKMVNTGFVDFDVRVDCPSCKMTLYLNKPPYDEDGISEVGMALFGSKNTPAKWHDLEIEIECCNLACQTKFIMNKFEY